MKVLLSASGVCTGESELLPLSGLTVPTVSVNLRRVVLERLAKSLAIRAREAARQSDMEEAHELEADLAAVERKIELLRAIKTKRDIHAYNRYLEYVSENA
jgi:hypothetical protein